MKGKISAGIFKVMAVVSALAIGGGYVGWRQMEADKANKRERNAQAKAKEAKDLELMVGSKNPGDRVLTREQIDTMLRARNVISEVISDVPEGAGDVQDVVPLLPGSKSKIGTLFKEVDFIELMRAHDKSGKEVEIVPEDLLPSSKIGIIRLPKIEVEPPVEVEPPEEKKPKLLPGSKSFLVIPNEPEADLPE